jgi:hypothetical protein
MFATTSPDSPEDCYHPAVTKMVSGRLRIVHSELLHCHQKVVRIWKSVAQLFGRIGSEPELGA